jgi:hypothetical protein
MPQALKRRTDAGPFINGNVAPAKSAWLATSWDEPAESPARRLQLQLEHGIAEPVVPRWSARRAIAFMAVLSAALWAATAWAGWALLTA